MFTKDWGLDLTGRKMWYKPWPIDADGRYFAPLEKEINDIYGISGEAVKETLVYFEECGGDTKQLVDMLNDHIVSSEYRITREGLLNSERWYTNEYYFYFIMFSKKIIGRYDFHFGENSDEQLSVYHKIYEKGFLKFYPWGEDENGNIIQDKSILVILVHLTYLAEVMELDYSDLFVFINSNLNKNYIINKSFYFNETNWVSAEFCYYNFEFIKIITNQNFLFDKSAYWSSVRKMRLARMSLVAPKKISFNAVKMAVQKTNNMQNYNFIYKKCFFRVEISLKKEFNVGKYSLYRNSCMINELYVHNGAFAACVEILFNLPEKPSSNLIYYDPFQKGTNIIFEYKWPRTNEFKSIKFLFLVPFNIGLFFILYNVLTLTLKPILIIHFIFTILSAIIILEFK